MGRSDENNPGVIGPANFQGGSRFGGKIPVATAPNRRALSNINGNIIGAPQPSAVNKRTLPEKHVICKRNPPPVPVHRPITRRYAAELASKQQLKSEESKRPCLSAPSHGEPDGSAINTDDCKTEGSDESPVPMFVQHTEAILDEIDQMEVDMEDLNEDQVADIDICDKKNPLAVVEYIDDIYSSYKEAEKLSCVPSDYMAQQFDINERMRGILIDWLIEVHYKFELMEETLYLTVNLIDRFLAVQQVVRKKLQLVGVTAMLLACKYEEVSVPVVEDLVMISDRAYCRKEVLDMEKSMVNKLKFNLSVPTAYVFMRRFLKAAQSDKKLELLSFFMIELCLVEYEMLKFQPSLLAAAAIYTAQCSLSGFKQWSKISERYTGYKEDQLLECSRLMVAFHQKAGTGKLTGVYRKYSTSKFGHAAKSEPANFLLEARF